MKYKSLSAIVLTVITLCSCNRPCREADCIGNNLSGYFRVVSAATGTDLIFGNKRIYDKNAIRFFSLKDADTTFFESQSVKYSYNSGYDSVLYVMFDSHTETAYIQLSSTEIDTFHIFYKTYDRTECCGPRTEITTFENKNLVSEAGVQEIRK